MKKAVVVIDDDELFRAGITRLIDSFNQFEVKLSLTTDEFTEKAKKIKKKSRLVLYTPPANANKGVEQFKDVVNTFMPSPVMVFSNYFSKQLVMKAIESGTSAYYTKGISPKALEGIMNELTANEVYTDIKLEPKVRSVLFSNQEVGVEFTTAEEAVLKLVCEQKSSSEISDELDISVRTVESRKRNMMLKTHSKNMIGVIMVYMRSTQQKNEMQTAVES